MSDGISVDGILASVVSRSPTTVVLSSACVEVIIVPVEDFSVISAVVGSSYSVVKINSVDEVVTFDVETFVVNDVFDVVIGVVFDVVGMKVVFIEGVVEF